jgi:adaptin ear-binding coat-associated protein 1/2
MAAVDPATGQTLSEDSLQRVLCLVGKVHVYNIPPSGPRGHVAATWTEDPSRQIFTARLRVLETSTTLASGDEKIKTDIVLEDPSNGQLFAAAPYTVPAVVEPVSDSSRFFALRVQDEQGRKASLGIGFEERSEAFDFSVSLQEAAKAMGLDPAGGKKPLVVEKKEPEEKRDYSLKEGETITVNLPGRFGRKRPEADSTGNPSNAPLSAFSLPPPPSASAVRGGGGIPPPPGSSSKAAKDLGFDDGKHGEFA